MERIKDTLNNVFASLALKKQKGKEEDIEQFLKKALTNRESKHIKFKYFQRGVLGIDVDSSAWLYSLSLKKDSLLKTLNKELPDIKEIRLRIGEIK